MARSPLSLFAGLIAYSAFVRSLALTRPTNWKDDIRAISSRHTKTGGPNLATEVHSLSLRGIL